MATYGPWRQDPDFEEGSTYRKTDTFNNRWLDGRGEAAFEVEQEGSAYVITEEDLRDALDLARTVNDSQQTDNPYGIMHAFAYSQSFPIWTSRWSAFVARNRWRVDVGNGFRYNPRNYGYVDPDAIGVEFEGVPFDPEDPWRSGPAAIQAARIDSASQIYTKVEDTSNSAGNFGVTQDWATHVIVSGEVAAIIPGIVERTAGFPTRSLGFDIDITAALGPDWAGELWTETPTFIGPASMDGGTIGSGTSVEYGWGFEGPRIMFTVRPGRYRFVYDVVETIPYRRTSHRHDSLAGGATRNYPPSRALQSSNRIGGGYL